MPLFSRRTLQRCLRETAAIIPLELRRAMANSFNSGHKQSLANQWELVLLNALRSAGYVEYQPDLGGKSRLDALVTSLGPEPSSSFAVEVTAVSDEDIRDLNPRDQLMEGTYHVMSSCGLPPDGLHLEIGSRTHSRGKKSEVVLALPTRRHLKSFIEKEVTPFIRKIAEDPRAEHAHSVESSQATVRMSYTPPGRQGTEMSYLGYEGATSISENSLARALERKARQVRHSGFAGPSLIVTCDAGAPVFGQSSTYSVTPAKVADSFLLAHREVAAVAILTARSYNHVPPAVDLRVNPKAVAPLTVEQTEAIGKALAQLPPTAVGIQNTRHLLRRFRGTRGLSLFGSTRSFQPDEEGGYVVKCEISARDLMCALAGTKEGIADFANRQLQPNVFKEARQHGYRLVAVRILPQDDFDDDWLEFEFAGKDPGWSPIEPE